MMIHLQKGTAKLLFLLVFFIGVLSYSASYSQANFTAICPQKKIGKNDYLQVEFKVDHASNVESIDPPSFKNFSVISGPNQETGMTSINGKVDQYVSISFVLKPNSPGNFTIGPATAKAEGKDFQSNSLNIQVTNSSIPSTLQPNNSSSNSLSSLLGGNSVSPFANLNFDFPGEPSTHQFDDYILKKDENVNDKVKKNLFIKLDVSKTSCYVGEPIVASYKLYTRLRSESTITNAPSFNGFSVSEMDLNNNNSRIEKYNGRDFNVYTLRKVQLYPLQPGRITLDPVVSDNKVTFIKAEYAGSQTGDMFFDMMQNFADATTPGDAMVEQHVTLKSKPVEITVKPLPEENKPADFKGSVGNFTIQSSLQKDNITTDDAGNLKIAISGSGNIQLINAPKINWPRGTDGYDAKVTDGIDKYSVPMKGSKTFTYPFTVSKTGTYTIPSISFSYFDPALATYKTLLTQPLVITVAKGKGIPNNTYVASKPIEQQPTTIRNALKKYALYFIIGIVSLAGMIFWIFQRNVSRKKQAAIKQQPAEVAESTGAEKEKEFVIPENPLEQAHQKLIEENSVAFYSVLDASLKKYLSAKFKVPAEELNKKRISEEMDKCNVGLGTSLRLSNLMDNIELNLYAPPSHINHLKEVYEKASEVVSLLDKQVC
jgi:BatD DUF11 like domain